MKLKYAVSSYLPRTWDKALRFTFITNLYKLSHFQSTPTKFLSLTLFFFPSNSLINLIWKSGTFPIVLKMGSLLFSFALFFILGILILVLEFWSFFYMFFLFWVLFWRSWFGSLSQVWSWAFFSWIIVLHWNFPSPAGTFKLLSLSLFFSDVSFKLQLIKFVVFRYVTRRRRRLTLT